MTTTPSSIRDRHTEVTVEIPPYTLTKRVDAIELVEHDETGGDRHVAWVGRRGRVTVVHVDGTTWDLDEDAFDELPITPVTPVEYLEEILATIEPTVRGGVTRSTVTGWPPIMRWGETEPLPARALYLWGTVTVDCLECHRGDEEIEGWCTSLDDARLAATKAARDGVVTFIGQLEADGTVTWLEDQT